MANQVDKVTFRLDLSKIVDQGITRSQKKEIGQYLVEQILEDVGKGKSPVRGQGWKSTLSPKYKKYKANFSSNTTANMELHGDMLDALKFKVDGDVVEVGIFNSREAQKADNHNKFSTASMNTPVPKRQFIPNNERGETFRKDIISEVERLLEG
jgi:hypothetical protein